MRSSTKSETSPSTGAKKLVQARLPFKTLSDGLATSDESSSRPRQQQQQRSIGENRKRKLSATNDEDIPVAKQNRKSLVKSGAEEVVPIIDLLANESMEASVDMNMKPATKEKKRNSLPVIGSNDTEADSDDVKENSVRVLGSENEDGADDNESDDKEDASKSPKAKKCLDMNDIGGESSGLRKSKRIREEVIKIKLPIPKKAAAKKTKKSKKNTKNTTDSADEFDDKNQSLLSIAESDAEAIDTDADTSMLDTSIISTDSPIRSSLNESNVSLNTTPLSNLTPKQLARKIESEKKLMEKQLAREERERKIQEEKLQRQREKEEKEEQRKREREEKEKKRLAEIEAKEEQKKREREEKEKKRLAEIEAKEEQKKRERDEKERKRLADIEAKNEDRKRREEQREEEKRKRDELKEEERRKREEQKEEERRKKEEEKRLREEADKLKNRRTAENFAKFFERKTDVTKKDATENVEEVKETNFMSFQVKDGMKLAPTTRRTLLSNDKMNLERRLFSNAVPKSLYLAELKSGKREVGQSPRTWQPIDDEQQVTANNDEEDVQILDDFGVVDTIESQPVKRSYRAKFLKFCENRRPAYYGTWRKKSTVLKPRKPFTQDKNFFDYDVDSDLEWEEEDPGESLSDDEADKESDDDYDIDNEFFVPHGHLSDEELDNDDELCDSTPEAQKAKLKIAQQQFDNEWKKKTEKLKPRVIGLIWQNADGSKPDNCSDGIWSYLNARACQYTAESIVLRADVADSDAEDAENRGPKRIKLTDDTIPDLIRLLHGNRNGLKFLIDEFRAFQRRKNEGENLVRKEFSSASIQNKIRELAEKIVCTDQGPLLNKMCWFVNADKRTQYSLADLPLANTWTYVLKPKIELEKERDSETNEDGDSKGAMSESLTAASVKQASSKQSAFNIAKFIRVLSDDEKKKQFGSLTLRAASPINMPSTSEAKPSPKARSTKKSPPSSKELAGRTPSTSATPPISATTSKSRKRGVLLLSCPRGEDFSPNTKNTIVTQFLNAAKRKKENEESRAAAAANGGSSQSTNDVIVLD